MEITVKKLAELKKADRNVRRHTEKQLSEYVRSVKMFGQVKPLLVDENGVIIAGNGLYDALIRAGKEEADCYIIKGLTEKEKKKLMLADNRVYELGMTDSAAFEDIIRELDGDIDVPGWDADLLETLNSSFAETTEEVESYGVFEEHQVQNIDRHESIEHRPQTEAPANYVPVQEQPAEPEPVPQSNVTAAESAEVQRYIICPKCGERICL